MSNPNEGTGSWKTIPPNHQAAYRPRPAQEWRRIGDSDDSMLSRMPLWARRFLGGLTTLGLAGFIGLLIYWAGLGTATELKVHVIGFSPYDDAGIPPNAFGSQDAQAFFRAHQAKFLVGNLTGSGLRLVLKQLENADEDTSNLIVLLNLHGVVAMKESEQPRALFLAQDATPDSPFLSVAGELDSPVIGLDEILASLKKASERRKVLLLIDVGHLGTNWRLGHLNNDLPSQLKHEIRESAPENLHVILSTDDGETSWTMDEERESVFSHYVLKGLAGEADGWHTTDSGPAQEPGNQNHRISCSELACYLQKKVQQWSRQHRGVTQSVTWPTARPNNPDFELIAVLESTPEEDPGETDEPVPGDQSGKEAEKTETASDTKKDNKSDQAGKSPAIEAETAESAGNPPSGDTPGSTLTTQELEDELSKLADLWQDRDDLRRDHPDAALFGPRSWRALQTHLLHAEQLLRYRIDASTDLEKAGGLVTSINKLLTGESVSTELSRGTRSSLSIQKLSLQPSEQLDGTSKETIRTLVDAAWRTEKAPPAKPAEKTPAVPGAKTAADSKDKPTAEDEKTKSPSRQEAIDELAKQVNRKEPSHRAVRLEIADRLISLLSSTGEFTQQEFQKCRPILELIGDPGVPSELVTLKRLTSTAAGARELGIRWDKDFAASCRDAFNLRVGLEAFAAKNSDLLPRLEELLKTALRHTAAAERWLEQGGSKHAAVQIDRAQDVRETLLANKDLIRRAVLLRAKLMIELPGFTRWIANRMEDDPTRCLRTPPLAQLAKELRRSLGLFKNLDRSPLKEQEEKNLLKVVLGVRELNRLLDESSRDETPNALEEKCDQLQEDYDAFQAAFSSRIKELTPEVPIEITPSEWREIDRFLGVPWIAGKKRAELLSQLRTVKASTVAGDVETKRELPGVWQSFWAIQALSLSVPAAPASAQDTAAGEGPVDLATLWSLWDEFINVAVGQEHDQQTTMVARLRLGREINSAWRGIADALGDPSRATPDQARQQALLVRSLDAADAPDPRLERIDSIVQVSRLRTTRDLLERRSEWSQRQQPPAWLKNWVPRQIDCASKTTPGDSGHEIGLTIPPQALDGPWKLAFEGSSEIQPWFNGKEVTGALSLTDSINKIRIKLGNDVGFSKKWLTIAVLDKSGFPVALERIPVIPPFDPTKWRIVFLSDGEKSQFRPDQRGGRNDLLTPESGPRVLILRLPPAPFTAVEMKVSKDAKDKDPAETTLPGPSVHQLTPYLVRPKKVESQSVTVTVLRRTSTGQPPQQFLQGEFPLDGSGRLIPLTFKPATDKPFPETDLSNGFIVKLKLQGNSESKTFDFQIQPDFWHPRNFLRVSEPQFENLRLSWELGRQPDVDSQLPPGVDVELCLPPRLQAMAKESYLKARVGSQGEVLFAEFDKSDRDRLRGPWNVSLKVSGFPRAFVRSLQYGSPPVPQPTGLSIIAPDGGPIVDKDANNSGRLVVDINSPDFVRDILGDPWKLDTGWSIQYRFEASDGQVTRPWTGFRLRYPVRKQFDLLGIKDGSWKLRGRVADHTIRFPDRRGRYTLRADLASDSQVVSRAASMEVGVDTAQSKPRVTISASSPFEIGPDLEVEITARDDESGIRKVVVGFDMDRDGKLLGDNDIRVEKRLAGTEILATRPFTLKLPKEDIPKTEGEYQLLASATNGINVSSDLVKHAIKFVFATGRITLRSLKGTTGDRGRIGLTLTGPDKKFSENFFVGRNSTKADVTKSSDIELAPGEYTLTDVTSKKTLKIKVVARMEFDVVIDYLKTPPKMVPGQPRRIRTRP